MSTVKVSKKRRKAVVIGRQEAMRRLGSMISRINQDIHIALWAEAVLEGGNNIVQATPNARRPGAHAYNVIQQSLAFNLAVSLARLFDEGSKRFAPNKRDLASLPLIIRLLKQRRCQRQLVAHSRKWTPQLPHMAETHARACQKAIDRAIEAFQLFGSTPSQRTMGTRLKRFRNKRLAHSLMDDALRTLPKFKELFQLLAIACVVVENARLAIDGDHMNLDDFRIAYKETAKEFWDQALR